MKIFHLIIAVVICANSFSQELDQEAGGTVMRKDFSFGLNFNANAGATGWGLGFDYGFQKNYKYKHLIGFTCTNIRHPKEYKILSNFSNSRGYFYGKLNSLVSLRPTYGGKLLLFKGVRENGIEISAKWSVGPSIGLLKPVYLKIDKMSGKPTDEKYDPTIHNSENISTRSNWTKGLKEAKLTVGGFLKAGLDFNFSSAKNAISGGEVGIMLDYFPGQKINLLHYNDAQKIFGSLYLQFNIGQKLY